MIWHHAPLHLLRTCRRRLAPILVLATGCSVLLAARVPAAQEGPPQPAVAPAEKTQPARPQPGHEFRIPISAETAAWVDELIDGLGAPAHAERESATTSLKEVGIAAFAQLHRAYHASTDLEVKLRIERVVRDVYLDHYLFSRNAFLGVSQSPLQNMTSADDRRIQTGCMGIYIDGVTSNTSAARGGIQPNDVIIAFNGTPFPIAPDPSAAFGEVIRTHGPGATLEVTVLRGLQTRTLTVKLGARPLKYYSMHDASGVMLLAYQKRLARWWREQFLKLPDETDYEPPRTDTPEHDKTAAPAN